MISTKNINPGKGGSLSKVLEPGNKQIKINCIALEEGYKEDSYNLIFHCEGVEQPAPFEGFFKDKDRPKQGRYKGQVGRVKAGEWPFNDFVLADGNKIVRDDEILKYIKYICDALDTTWLEEQDNKHETIEELVTQFNLDAPFLDVYFNTCLCGKEYMNKSGYINYELFFPKFTRQGFPFEKMNEDSDTSNVYVFDTAKHIKVRKKPTEVDSFNNNEKNEEVSDDFEL